MCVAELSGNETFLESPSTHSWFDSRSCEFSRAHWTSPSIFKTLFWSVTIGSLDILVIFVFFGAIYGQPVAAIETSLNEQIRAVWSNRRTFLGIVVSFKKSRISPRTKSELGKKHLCNNSGNFSLFDLFRVLKLGILLNLSNWDAILSAIFVSTSQSIFDFVISKIKITFNEFAFLVNSFFFSLNEGIKLF